MGLSACTSLPDGLGPSEAGAVSSQTTAPELKHIVDISGCWRPVGSSLIYSDGATFTIFAIASNMFIMGKAAHTRFVIDEDFSFIEENRDPKKPFYPPGYLHSKGIVSKDGLAISRSLIGQSGTKEYRRCANVQQAPPGLRDPVKAVDPNEDTATDGSNATPSPQGTIAPLISRLKPSPSSPTPSPAVPEPLPEPTPRASAP